MRIALAEGMHTDMPIAELGEPFVQRCRKIWWSIYILDRQMSSQMGVPQSIGDDDITCQLTNFLDSTQRTAALKMQIKLARVYADIARSESEYPFNSPVHEITNPTMCPSSFVFPIYSILVGKSLIPTPHIQCLGPDMANLWGGTNAFSTKGFLLR